MHVKASPSQTPEEDATDAPADEVPPEDDVTPPDEDEDIRGGASESEGE
jgi:hypothetical protein